MALCSATTRGSSLCARSRSTHFTSSAACCRLLQAHGPQRPTWQRRAVHAFALGKEPSDADADAQQQSYGGLAIFLKDLSEEDQELAFSKLAAAGFAKPGAEHAVDVLTNDQLRDMGVGPQALRSRLLKAFARAGPSKTVILFDSEGTEKKLVFENRPNFDKWVISNNMIDGRNAVINDWEQLQDGGRYYTDRRLEKTVADLENYQRSQDKALENEIAEFALREMRKQHPEAKRYFCDASGELSNSKTRRMREFDEVIVTNNRCEVIEVKQVVDIDGLAKLQSAISFIENGVADGLKEFDFARRSDGSMKEITGALGGARMVDGERNQRFLKDCLEKAKWKLYIPDGGRMGSGNSCHHITSP